jgi:dTDP-4-amino-4,6-dideoxygalactose transaminase
MKVRFLNLSVTDTVKRAGLLSAIEKVLIHGQIVMGPEVAKLESEISAYCGVPYAVGVNSGTDALYLALRSLGIGNGDEVITTSLSWIATANAISLTGAKPVFVDIREDFNIDPAKISRAVTKKTKALVIVHFTGKMCDMDAIVPIADKSGIALIEDAAQAFGASYKGKKAGAFGVVSALSMNPMKVFAACGEAGFVFTTDEKIYELLKILRYNGTVDKVNAHYKSLNGRIDTIQAAILLERLKYFETDIEKRRAIAKRYNEALSKFVGVPLEAEGCKDVFYTYNALCPDRDRLMSYLTDNGIETKIHHPLLMPHHEVYRSEYAGGSWPTGDKIVSESLCLPIHENLTEDELDYVIDMVSKFYRKG